MIRFFCAGETRANTCVVSATCASAGSVIRVQIVAETMSLGFESYLRADVAGDEFVVAGQNLQRQRHPF